jgi:hypothetical protein
MKSRRFTAQYLPCFQTKGISQLGTAALRDFNHRYDRLGSKCENLAMSICRPVYPK